VSGTWVARTSLGKAVLLAGFEYLPSEDIITSTMGNFQRSMGYCRLFDDSAIGMGSVLDAEPFRFAYGGYEWMIELWKGQYGIESGCEIGVYRRPQGSPLDFGELLGGEHYGCVPNEAMLPLRFDLSLRAKGEPLFSMGEKRHWWLTGFKWGSFVEPEELSMDVAIAFDDAAMADGFLESARALGYAPSVGATGSSISFTFDRPKSPQSTFREALRGEVQKANHLLVGLYAELKKDLGIESNDPDELDEKIRADRRTGGLLLLNWIETYFGKRRRLG